MFHASSSQERQERLREGKDEREERQERRADACHTISSTRQHQSRAELFLYTIRGKVAGSAVALLTADRLLSREVLLPVLLNSVPHSATALWDWGVLRSRSCREDLSAKELLEGIRSHLQCLRHCITTYLPVTMLHDTSSFVGGLYAYGMVRRRGK